MDSSLRLCLFFSVSLEGSGVGFKDQEWSCLSVKSQANLKKHEIKLEMPSP